jgi:hypothetical protein
LRWPPSLCRPFRDGTTAPVSVHRRRCPSRDDVRSVERRLLLRARLLRAAHDDVVGRAHALVRGPGRSRSITARRPSPRSRSPAAARASTPMRGPGDRGTKREPELVAFAATRSGAAPASAHSDCGGASSLGSASTRASKGAWGRMGGGPTRTLFVTSRDQVRTSAPSASTWAYVLRHSDRSRS